MVSVIQITWSSGTALILPEQIIEELEGLNEITQDARIVKFLQDAATDTLCLRQLFGIGFIALADTQELYTEARAYSGQKIGFTDLVNAIVQPPQDLSKNKKTTMTNWRNRPLSDEQVIYAIRDSYYLRPAGMAMMADLPRLKTTQVMRDTYLAVQKMRWKPDKLLTWTEVDAVTKIPENATLAVRNVHAALVKDRRERSLRNNTREDRNPSNQTLQNQAAAFCGRQPGEAARSHITSRLHAVLRAAYEQTEALTLWGGADPPTHSEA